MSQSTPNPHAMYNSCWDAPGEPTAELIAKLKSSPFTTTDNVAKLAATLRRDDVARPTIFIGAGTCGLGAGAEKTIAAIKQHLTDKGQDAEVVEVGCVGLCSEEPIVDVQFPGKARLCFGNVTSDVVPGLLTDVFAGSIPQKHLLGQYFSSSLALWDDLPRLDQHPFLKLQKRWVLANSGIIDPENIDEYIARGGYVALAKTLAGATPDEVCDIVDKSGLRGRGGGGFPAGKKWKFARASVSEQKYLICNADEGDPGAFMDRAVCESDPYRLLEGMVIAAYAIGATKAYIYIRAEYPLAIKRLRHAIAEATRYGLLGKDILGSGFKLEIIIKMGAGAFVCGEETALIHSIEGKRGMPRPRPPYPPVRGLFDKPTVINNVETLANVSTVLDKGWEAFAAVGTKGSKGTKVFALSGNVCRTGLVEVPMGTTIRQVVFSVGGGAPNGNRCKAVQIGGPSGGCIPEPQMDLPCDYEALKDFGAIMGSGGLVVMDQHTCMVDLAKYFMEFIQSESCGKCIPCREGTKRMLEILEAITRGPGREHETDALLRFQGVMYLEKLAKVIKDASLCGLGQTAPNPVLSTLRWFRDEYEAHIYDRQCPAGACKELVGAPCQSGCPVGTEVWRYVAHIARGEHEAAYKVIRDANPLPSVCARVCDHPCESMCRAGTTGGDPIAIRTLKRYVVDHIDPNTYRPTVIPAAADAPKIAVIGAGPSGITAAHYLSLKGYRVTLFEKEDRPGGMLTAAIPSYRLPRETLNHEIAGLLNANIEVRCNTCMGSDFTPEELLTKGYQAVYVSIGSHESQKLGIAGEDTENVFPGIKFLKAYNLRGETLATGRVGVIGGGNSAVDAARVAIRQPGVKSVTLYYRRTRNEMPAYEEEIHAALEEGVAITELAAPLHIEAVNGKLARVTFQRNRLGSEGADGRRRPEPVEGSEYSVPLDTLIVAIGEAPETKTFKNLSSTKGRLSVNPESLLTEHAGIFGGGDVATGPNTVISAIAAGKRAALMIDRHLKGKKLKLLPKMVLPAVFVAPPMDEEVDESAAQQARLHPALLDPTVRIGGFEEVELCVAEHHAVCEARRCMRCDLEFTRPS